MPTKMTVVLISGGLDSAVAAALARQSHALALLHFQFGQQAAEPEARAFAALCEFFRPAHKQIASLGDWRALSPSPLLRPHVDVEDAPAVTTQLASSFVPMLAPAMLCAAAGWAYTLGADQVVWGASLANPGNYPDRTDAIRLLAWQLASRALPEGQSPAFEAPLAQYDKPAVVELAIQLKIPLEVTWSCLRGGDHPCGRCIACASRKRALDACALPEPAKAKP